MANLYREEMQTMELPSFSGTTPAVAGHMWMWEKSRRKKPKPDHINAVARMGPARDEGKEEKISEKVWLSWLDSQREETER